MNFTIDKIFSSKSYRYIPTDIRNEWKTIYNYYANGHYEKMYSINIYNPQITIDLHNEQRDRLNRVLNRLTSFSKTIKDIQPETVEDTEHAETAKTELANSLNLMKLFIKERQAELDQKMSVSDMPLRQNENNEPYDMIKGNGSNINLKTQNIEYFGNNSKKGKYNKLLVILLLACLGLIIFKK